MSSSSVTTPLLTFVAAVAAASLLWSTGRRWVDLPGWRRTNYRGAELAGVGGVVVVAVGLAAVVVLAAVEGAALADRPAYAAALALLGFAALGLNDDLREGQSGGGFRRHLTTLISQRRITTGLVKLGGGAVLGVIVVWWATGGESSSWLGTVRGGALVALGANTINLFDRAPARASKVAALWWTVMFGVALAVADERALLLASAAGTCGAAVGLARFEVRELVMLGDTGANALGAMLGLGAVLVATSAVEWALLGLLLGLNLVSERISFTAVIDGTPWLRRIDRWGSAYRT